MESTAFQIAKKVLNEQKKSSKQMYKNAQSIDRFLNLVEKCGGKNNGNNDSKQKS
jgi:translation initiation factor 2 alpha subunit (eIF-2alpha)